MITKSCPPPLSGLFVWGECFAYFGSGGDTFDFDIIEAYASEKVRKKFRKLMMDEEFGEDEEEFEPYIEDRSANFPEISVKSVDFSEFDPAFSDLLGICVPRLSQELEQWVLDVHKTVPVVFLEGPHGVEEEDEWNIWSRSNADRAVDAALEYTKKNPAIVKKTEGSDSDSQTAREGLLSPSEQSRYFGYIFNNIVSILSNSEVELTPEQRASRMQLAEMIYGLDGIDSAFDRLSIEEHNIHSNAKVVDSALSGLSGEERFAKIGALSPYAQMAYYASYTALKAGDLTGQKGFETIIAYLVKSWPEGRARALTSFLSMIAHNMVKITPAYQKPDKTHAPVAAEVFAYVCRRADAGENDFISGVVCCEWAKNPALGVELAELGLAKFPKSKLLVHNAIAVNNLAQNHDKSKELLSLYSTLSDKLEEDYVLNSTFNMIKKNKPKDALKLINTFLEQGGKRSVKILTNLFYCYQLCPLPPKPDMDALVKDTDTLIRDDSAYRDIGLLENFLCLISSHGYLNATVDLIDFLDSKMTLSASCWVNYTYAAYSMDQATQEKVIEKMDAMAQKKESFLGDGVLMFGNTASIHCKLGNEEKALSYLKLCKKYNHPRFPTFPTDEDYKILWDKPEFKKLFR